jgi:Protein of unknown function (DUF3991)
MVEQSLDRELERFKQEIDLVEFICSFGFAIDRKESHRQSIVLRNKAGEKLCVGKALHDEHWIYWNARLESDAGSIIDFVQKREGGNLGAVRKRLRQKLGTFSISTLSVKPSLLPISPDLNQMLIAYSSTEPCSEHPYLTQTRKIPSTVLVQEKFSGRIRIDTRGNAIFPHFNYNGVCGFEIKNVNFTGFSANGTRGLWCSIPSPHDTALILTESAIDAFSYEALWLLLWVVAISR